MKRCISALATAGLLAGVFGFAAPRAAQASGVIWVSQKGTPFVDVNNLEYTSLESSMGNGPWRVNRTRDGYDCLHPDYNDIQLAVDNADDNDTIYICPGLWKMSLAWQIGHGGWSDSAVVTSNPYWPFDDTTGLHFVGAGANKTIIDGLRGGNKLFRAFNLWSSNTGIEMDASFSSLTIQNFEQAVYGASIDCDHATFKNNGTLDTYAAGAIHATGLVDMAGCAFVGNRGGVDMNGGAITTEYLEDHGSTFVDNRTNGDGGAIYANAVALHGTVLTRNVAGGEGGAVATSNCDGSTYDHVTATGNKALSGGGGAILVGDCNPTSVYVTSSVFKNNSASDRGGAIEADGADVYVSGSAFQQNRAGLSGGAVFGHEIFPSGNRFIGNVSGVCGGAIYYQVSIATPEANTYRGNRDAVGFPNWC